MIRIRRALLSAYHKEGLDELAAALRDTGAEILSTGGTYRWLLDRGFAAVSLEERYGLPSRFGGRVKTLHPSIHGGILYRRGDPQDEADREALRIDPIDLVAIDLYPFEETARRDPSARAAAIEMIDIGGPTMLRAAAKNHASVAVVCDPADYGAVANALREGRGSLAEPLLEALAVKVFETTAAYDARVASYLQPKESLPDAFARGERRLWALRYGENPSQRGAFYGPPAGYPGGMRKLQGKEISFNNLQDMEAAATLARDLMPEPGAVVIKHATPCGAACADSIAEAYRDARDGDALSAFGGVVGVNRPVDRACAEELAKTFLELVVAPRFDPEARSILAAKKNLVLLEGEEFLAPLDDPVLPPFSFRDLGNGILVQDRMRPRLGEEGWKVVTRRAPTEAERQALAFAWRIVRMVRSNAIVFAKGRRTIGIGGGQTSRIDSVTIALHKARREGHDPAGSVMASDAFFPFPDCVEEAAKAGATAIVQPGGSKRDSESVEAADRLGLAMVVNEARAFRHG